MGSNPPYALPLSQLPNVFDIGMMLAHSKRLNFESGGVFPRVFLWRKPDRSAKFSRFPREMGVNRPDAPADEEPLRERIRRPSRIDGIAGWCMLATCSDCSRGAAWLG